MLGVSHLANTELMTPSKSLKKGMLCIAFVNLWSWHDRSKHLHLGNYECQRPDDEANREPCQPARPRVGCHMFRVDAVPAESVENNG